MSLSLTLRLVTAAAMLVAAARLDAQASSLIAVRPDSIGHRLAIDATRLKPVRLLYRATLVRDSVTLFGGDVQVDVTEVQYAGAPAWLLAQSGSHGTSTSTDSLIVARADLRPLHWSSVQGAARLAAEFTPDTVFGAMSSPLGRQNIVLGNRPDLLPSAMSVDAVLTALPLSAGWRDSAHVLVVDAGGASIAPAALAVDSAEHIVVPAGEYDCWVVSLETERGSSRYWVSKDGLLVVRTEQILPQLGGAILSRELAYVQPIGAVPPSDRPR